MLREGEKELKKKIEILNALKYSFHEHIIPVIRNNIQFYEKNKHTASKLHSLQTNSILNIQNYIIQFEAYCQSGLDIRYY